MMKGILQETACLYSDTSYLSQLTAGETRTIKILKYIPGREMDSLLFRILLWHEVVSSFGSWKSADEKIIINLECFIVTTKYQFTTSISGITNYKIREVAVYL